MKKERGTQERKKGGRGDLKGKTGRKKTKDWGKGSAAQAVRGSGRRERCSGVGADAAERRNAGAESLVARSLAAA